MTRSRGARSSRWPYVAAVLLAFSAFLLVAGLSTFHDRAPRPAFPDGPLASQWANSCGLVGQAGARLCLDAFGWAGAWLFPLTLLVWSWNRLRRRAWVGAVVPTFLGSALALALSSLAAGLWGRAGGGAVGLYVAHGARSLLGNLGSLIFLVALAVLAVGFVAEREMVVLWRWARKATAALAGWLARLKAEARERRAARAGEQALAAREAARKRPPAEPRPVVAPADREGPKRRPAETGEADQGPRIVTTSPASAPSRREADRPAGHRKAAQMPLPAGRPPREPLADAGSDDIAGEESVPAVHVADDETIPLPGFDILEMPADSGPSVNEAELLESSKILVQTLADFGVTGRVGEVHPGPIITRFEFEPAAGVRIAQILNRADDLALALKAIRIRIVAPIPGKAAVGVEIPNRNPATVYLKEILDRPEFKKLAGGLPMALGKDIGGKPYYADLSRMPHLLIAGTTGSGKSVCVNAIITSLIMRKTPRELRLLMIDPKMLELPVYNGVPHLLMPVVTDPKIAARTLRGLISEMERRYSLLARRGVRNVDAYHERLDEDVRDGCETIGERLPYIVAIIDELADLMVTTASEIEEPIGRLAQTARAVGIHLIVATQRPSVDVITGVIKANFPSRIAFQVASKTDSRTILDMNGAESLLGRGDMLFLPSGKPEADRVHGAFVSDRETERLVKYWRRVKPRLPSIDLQAEKENESAGGIGGDDPLFEDAARLVVLHQQGSASLLQRRLKVGYSRAARLVDMLEEAGIVAPSEGAKAREVLVDEARLEEIISGRGGEALKR